MQTHTLSVPVTRHIISTKLQNHIHQKHTDQNQGKYLQDTSKVRTGEREAEKEVKCRETHTHTHKTIACDLSQTSIIECHALAVLQASCDSHKLLAIGVFALSWRQQIFTAQTHDDNILVKYTHTAIPDKCKGTYTDISHTHTHARACVHARTHTHTVIHTMKLLIFPFISSLMKL